MARVVLEIHKFLEESVERNLWQSISKKKNQIIIFVRYEITGCDSVGVSTYVFKIHENQ